MRGGVGKKAAWVGVGVWVVLVGVGMGALVGYEGRAGEVGVVPGGWPAGESRLVLDGRVPTLVMFLHPKCPCSEASVEELNRVMARFGAGKVSAWVVASVPAGVEKGWEETGLVGEARRIPGVKVVVDEGGVEARRFGARTSGQVDLYDARGRLAYQGGVTAGRGHAGDNANLDAVVAVLEGREPGRREGRVFGCSILGEARGEKREGAKDAKEDAKSSEEDSAKRQAGAGGRGEDWEGVAPNPHPNPLPAYRERGQEGSVTAGSGEVAVAGEGGSLSWR